MYVYVFLQSQEFNYFLVFHFWTINGLCFSWSCALANIFLSLGHSPANRFPVRRIEHRLQDGGDGFDTFPESVSVSGKPLPVAFTGRSVSVAPCEHRIDPSQFRCKPHLARIRENGNTDQQSITKYLKLTYWTVLYHLSVVATVKTASIDSILIN